MEVDITSKRALYLQIYDQCKQLILSSVYPAGEKLPPIRKLAADVGVARNTVEQAYRQLMQEGYVTSRSGSGYIVENLDVSEILISAKLNLDFDPTIKEEHRVLLGLSPEPTPCRYDFTYGNLQAGFFPADKWRKITGEILTGSEVFGADRYNDNQGDYGLRIEIVKHLRKSRGVRCFPEQVVIQPGTPSAIQNLLQLFDAKQDEIAVEEPGYDGTRRVMEHMGFSIIACPVHQGYPLFLQSVRASNARLIFVTPSNQFPTGAIMPQQMRQQIIGWAERTDAYIVEDDYCREFRYNGRATPSLQSLDTYDRVIYMGTFSKALSPALRLNYLILPPRLIKRWQNRYGEYHSSVPWLSQVVLRHFIEEGHWEKLLRRAQTFYRRKHDTLIAALKNHVGDKIDILEGGSGLHLLIGLRDERSQQELIELAAENDVKVYETDKYWIAKDHPLKSYILVGFSAIPEEDIEPGIEALAHAWFGKANQASTAAPDDVSDEKDDSE